MTRRHKTTTKRRKTRGVGAVPPSRYYIKGAGQEPVELGEIFGGPGGKRYTAAQAKYFGGRDWPDDRRGHSRASKLGHRRRKRRGRRDVSAMTDPSWFGHSLAHSRASKYGHKRKKLRAAAARRSRTATGRFMDPAWFDDAAGHSGASKLGWRRKKRKTRRRHDPRRRPTRRRGGVSYRRAVRMLG